MGQITLGEFKPTYAERQAEQKKYLDRLSSGQRVNSARDDATSLAIATRISADSQALSVAAINAAGAQAVLNIADGGLNAQTDVLNQLKSITTLAQSGIASPADLANLNQQFTALVGELDSIAGSTSFNGQNLLDGTSNFATGVNFQVGAGASDTINVTIGTTTSAALGLSGQNVLSAANANAASAAIDAALNSIAGQRADVGADSAAFATRADLITVSRDNADAAVSALLGADIGESVTGATSASVLNQLSLAALERKNNQRRNLLSLLN